MIISVFFQYSLSNSNYIKIHHTHFVTIFCNITDVSSINVQITSVLIQVLCQLTQSINSNFNSLVTYSYKQENEYETNQNYSFLLIFS